MKFARLSRPVRFAVTALVALVVGGLAVMGISAPAFATSPNITLTVKVVNKAGSALTSVAVYPIEVQDGVVAQPDGADLPAMTPVSGKPGYFSESVLSDVAYTIEIDPTGSSASNGTWQLLGGGELISQAKTFTPDSDTFITATFDNEGQITGKITSPAGSALKGAEADVYYYDGQNWDLGSWSLTGSTGVYTLTNLQPGSYKLKFWSPTGSYPPVYSGGSTTIDNASSVVVAPGKTVTVNAKFASFTGSITGKAVADYGFDGTIDDVNATATAYPVLEQSGGSASQIDYGHPVASGRANSSGVWTISNLQPGDYVVHIEPYYYNESQAWVESGDPNNENDPTDPLSAAHIFTVLAGSKLQAGTTYVAGNDNGDGADPQIFVKNANGTADVDAQVTLTNPADGLEYVSGVTSSGGAAQLEWSDGTTESDDLQPGLYTVTVVDPSQLHEPVTTTHYFPASSSGDDDFTVNLPNLIATPGFTTGPSISESNPQVGTTYTVGGQATNRPTDDSLVYSYQWMRGSQPIYGATQSSYTATGADLGFQLSVRVTASFFGFSPIHQVTYAPGGVETPGDAPYLTGDSPSITPATGVFVGTTLQAHTGDWSATGMNFTYQWQSGGSPINGATGSTYVVQSAYVNTDISVVVTGKKTGYLDGDAITSPATVHVDQHPAPINTKAPTVSKSSSHGNTTYTGNAGSWNTTGLTYTYLWSEGDPVTGTTLSMSNKFTAAGTGVLPDPVEYTVTATKDGYAVGKATIIVNKGSTAFTASDQPGVLDTTSFSDLSTDPNDAVYVGESLSLQRNASWELYGNPAVPDKLFTFQWYRQAAGKSPVAISGATHITYVVTTADINTNLTVKETTVSSTYTNATSLAAWAGLAHVSPQLVNSPGVVAVHGFLAQGQVLSAAVTGWPVSGVTNSYQWLDCPASSTTCVVGEPETYSKISGATKSTLTASAAYRDVIVEVKGSKSGYTTATIDSDDVTIDPATQIDTLSNPSISGLIGGKAAVGVKLTAVSGKYSVSGVTPHYTWETCLPAMCGMEGLSAIVSNASTYTPTAADYAGGTQVLELLETVTRTGYVEAHTSDHSTDATIALGTAKTVKAPTISTTTNTWGVNNGTYTPSGGTSLVRWYVDGILINSDDSTNLQGIDREYPGRAVWETSTYTVDGYTPITTQILVQRGSNMVVGTPATIASGAAYGDKLTASTGVISDPYGADASLKLSYQWYSNGAAIKGATGPSFTPSTSYINHKIQVKVTGSSSYYNSVSSESPSTFVLASGSFGTLADPTITFPGTLAPGVVMTANAVVPSGATVSRQWYKKAVGAAVFTAISKATAATYTPAATDVGAIFEVRITWTRSGFVTPPAQFSEPETVQYSPTLATLTPPVVSGTPVVGSTLTANPGTWNAPSLTYTYQWYRDDVLIPGATASTYTPDFTSATDTLSFDVTASRAGYQSVTVRSNDQAIGLGTITAVTAPKITGTSGSSTFSVSTGSWNVDGLSFSYQWQVGGVNATGTGATTDTYTRTDLDSGVLTVIITVSRPGYTEIDNDVITGPTLAARAG